MKARLEEQISVFLKNKKGILANLCAQLAERNVNIHAMTVVESYDIGTARLIVDNVGISEECLTEAGAAWIVVKVLAINIINRPGAIARIARTFGDAGVNIEYMYVTAMPGMEHTVGIFRVADEVIEKALALEFDA